MKKNEDLKTHLSEDKTGLRAGHLKNSFFLFFLLIYDLSYSQIPIDGFCALENYIVPLGYQSLLPADIDNNGTDELILISNSIRSIGIFFPSNAVDSQIVEFKTNAEISQLKKINDTLYNPGLFASVQRKVRKVSVLLITSDSLAENKGEITFDSFPENVSIGDVDSDGIDEILVSGSGFDGLSLLYRVDNNIAEKKIVNSTSYSEAIFIDLNADGYPDILAFNIFENALHFYFNNTNGEFTLERTLGYPNKLQLLRTKDLNEDGFDDIIYSSVSSVEIIFGDFQSAYTNKMSIQLKTKPDGLLFGNFNNDGFTDLAYLSTKEGTINLRFGTNNNKFYERITYLQKPSLNSISKLKIEQSETIACLSENGELSFIRSIKKLNGDIKIIPAIEPDVIKKFDVSNDGNIDISFVDRNDNSLKIFLNTKYGIPEKYYSLPLSGDHKEILTDDFFKQRKTFYCYTKDHHLVEVLGYNFKNNQLSKRQLYAPGDILDLALERIDSSLVNVFMLYNKQSKLYLGKYENRDLSVTFKEYPFIDRNVTMAELIVNGDPKIYYWKSEGENYYFNSTAVNNGPNVYKNYFQIGKSDSLKINLFGADYYNGKYPSVVSLVQKEMDNYALVITDDKIYVLSGAADGNPGENKTFGKGFFSETGMSGAIDFTVNSAYDNYINRLTYSDEKKSYKLIHLLAAENVSDYFITKLGQKKYYLVYSNKKEGFISVKSIAH